MPIFGAQKTGSPTHLISQTYEATLRWLGRTFARTEPMYGESAGASAWPLRQWCMASKWLLMFPTCVIDRIRLKCWVRVARRGCSSRDAHAGDRRGNGLVGAANFRRRLGLQVPGIEVTGPAAQQDKDARLLGGTAAKSSVAIDARGNHPRQAQSQGADPAGLEKSAARDQGGPLSPVARAKDSSQLPRNTSGGCRKTLL